jgi:5-methylcytosine-specific restriction endonuclease McrA
MRALREFPGIEAPLRDGRLSLTTAVTLRPVLTPGNLDEMVARAAFKTDEETKVLVASLRPQPPPREGIRKLPEPAPRLPEGPPTGAEATPLPPEAEPEPLALEPPARLPSRPSLTPFSEDQWSMRVTVDRAFKEDLEMLRSLLSHKLPQGDLSAVLREAVRCGIEKHGKRRGAVRPQRERKPAAPKPPPPGKRPHVPAAVRRAVWERDGGRCTFTSPDGHRCGSRRRLELDHVQADWLGGPPAIDNLRLRCRVHNALHAEETFGQGHMARFRRKDRPAPRAGDLLSPARAHPR